MNRQGLDHEPLFLALAWFNGMTATLMVGRLSRWFVAHSETPPGSGRSRSRRSERTITSPSRGRAATPRVVSQHHAFRVASVSA